MWGKSGVPEEVGFAGEFSTLRICRSFFYKGVVLAQLWYNVTLIRTDRYKVALARYGLLGRELLLSQCTVSRCVCKWIQTLILKQQSGVNFFTHEHKN